MNENLFEIFRRSFPTDPAASSWSGPTAASSATATCWICPAGWPRSSRIWASSRATASPPRWRRAPRRCMLYLGALRAGAVYLPLNTAYTEGEIRYFLGDAEPAAVRLPARAGRRRWRRWAASWACRTSLTLGERGDGSLLARVQAAAGRRRRRAARQGRPRGLPLHLGHDGPLQGRHAEPRQPRLERRGPARRLAVHRRRPAAPRAADLPHPRPVRRHQHHPDGRRLDALPAALRSRRDDAPAAAGRPR